LVSIPVYVTGAYLVVMAVLWCVDSKRLIHRVTGLICSDAPGNSAAVSLALVILAYLALELTRCIFAVEFDRHLLPLIPFVGILILIGLQEAGLQRMPVMSWIILVIFAGYGIAATQELGALARTRVLAIERLKAAGIKDAQIDAGFEHSYWTEADQHGYINDARLKNPAGAYDPRVGPTPHLIFLYRLERTVTNHTRPSSFGTLHYSSWLPPFDREVRIDQYDEPTPAPQRQLIPKLLLDQYR
jgi:hypothetical protein